MSKSIKKRIASVGSQLLEERARDTQKEFGKKQSYNVIGFLYGKEPELRGKSDPHFVYALVREDSEADVDDFYQRLSFRSMQEKIKVLDAGHYHIGDRSIDDKLNSEGYVSVPPIAELRKTLQIA